MRPASRSERFTLPHSTIAAAGASGWVGGSTPPGGAWHRLGRYDSLAPWPTATRSSSSATSCSRSSAYPDGLPVGLQVRARRGDDPGQRRVAPRSSCSGAPPTRARSWCSSTTACSSAPARARRTRPAEKARLKALFDADLSLARLPPRARRPPRGRQQRHPLRCSTSPGGSRWPRGVPSSARAAPRRSRRPAARPGAGASRPSRWCSATAPSGSSGWPWSAAAPPSSCCRRRGRRRLFVTGEPAEQAMMRPPRGSDPLHRRRPLRHRGVRRPGAGRPGGVRFGVQHVFIDLPNPI